MSSQLLFSFNLQGGMKEIGRSVPEHDLVDVHTVSLGQLAAGTIVVVLFLGGYLPWFLLTFGSQDPYVYYLLPVVPIMYLGFGVVADTIRTRWPGRITIAAVASLLPSIFRRVRPRRVTPNLSASP